MDNHERRMPWKSKKKLAVVYSNSLLHEILTRDEIRKPLANPAVLWDIETSPVLASTKLIAEAWDAAGLYQNDILINWAICLLVVGPPFHHPPSARSPDHFGKK